MEEEHRTRIKDKAKHSFWRFASIIPWFLLTGLIIWGLWIAFNKPTQNIIARRGSTVQVTQVNKTSRFFIPFAEIYGEQRNNSDFSTGIRVGCRIEF